MVTLKDIIGLISEKTGAKPGEISEHTDIFAHLGVCGDDFHELIEEYARRFQVDMTSYLWYFHADEEGQNIGGLFFKPPYARVERLPVTPDLLKTFANTRKWGLDYPEHQVPKKRYDLIFNQVMVLVTFFSIMIAFLWQWMSK